MKRLLWSSLVVAFAIMSLSVFASDQKAASKDAAKPAAAARADRSLTVSGTLAKEMKDGKAS